MITICVVAERNITELASDCIRVALNQCMKNEFCVRFSHRKMVDENCDLLVKHWNETIKKRKYVQNEIKNKKRFSRPSTAWASYCTNEWKRLSIINTYYCTHYAVGVRTFNLINPMYGMMWARVAPLVILFSIWFKLVAVWWMRMTECVWVACLRKHWPCPVEIQHRKYNEFGDARAPTANFPAMWTNR